MENLENQNIVSDDNTPEEWVKEALEPIELPEQPVEAKAEEEPVLQEPVQQTTVYRNAGVGRKESPYANSPYVMNHPPRQAAPVQPREEKPAAPRKKKKKKASVQRSALSWVLILALVIGSCAVTAGLVNARWENRLSAMESAFGSRIRELQTQMEAMSPAGTGVSVSGTGNGLTVAQVYARNVDSVVLIESTVTSLQGTGVSYGSGFVLTEDGYVVTNYHVVEGASSVNVVMVSGASHAAQIVGYDSTNDVAVLKIQASGLNAVELGSSSDLIVGDQVVAIGNPLGELTSTLTSGYVSGKERTVSTDGTVINMIQTDAAINSGNSGGPLFNMKGQVIGITTAKYSGSSSSGATIEGIGFAIPIDDVVDGISQLMENGYIRSGFLGVMVRDVDPSVAELYGLPMGAYVESVEPGYCAERAGIQAKDIIVGVNDVEVASRTDLTRALRGYEPGETVQVKIYRAGLVKTLDVTLDERPRDLDTTTPSQEQGQMPEGSFEDWYDYFAPFFGFGNGG